MDSEWISHPYSLNGNRLSVCLFSAKLRMLEVVFLQRYFEVSYIVENS